MDEIEPEQTTDRRRSRLILLAGAAGALLLALIFILVARSGPTPTTAVVDLLRAGSPEFEGYKSRIALNDKEIIVHPNMIGMAQYEVRARLVNQGDRALTAVEMGGKMLDLQDKVIAENASLPVPRVRRNPLGPGESMPVSVKVDAPAKVTEADVKDVLIEVRGLKFE